MTYIEKLYKRYEASNEGTTFERWLVNELERLEAKYTSAGTLEKELISPCCKTKLRITNDETIICDSCGSEWDSCGNLIIEAKEVFSLILQLSNEDQFDVGRQLQARLNDLLKNG